jgi:hypothetical protein
MWIHGINQLGNIRKESRIIRTGCWNGIGNNKVSRLTIDGFKQLNKLIEITYK